jgi:transcriptional regulator with XRE-family HTH domain
VPRTKRPAIGQRLRALRLHLRWSQNDLSGRAELRRIEISAIESGRNLGSSWRVRTLLAQGLGVSKDDLDAYFEGTIPLDEIAAKIRPRDPAKPARAKSGRRPLAYGKGAPPPPGFFSKFPNLREAVRVVARDEGLDEELVKQAAYRVADSSSSDKKILHWGRLIEADLGRGSSARLNPLRVPNLAAAIRLLAQENPHEEPRTKEVAATLVAEHDSPFSPTTMEWLRKLDHALGARAESLGQPGRTAVRKRTPPKG